MARTSGSSAACATKRHHRVVGVVGMVQQHVAFVENDEEVACCAPREDVDRPRMRWIAELREARQFDRSPSARGIERSRDGVYVVGSDVEPAPSSATSSADAIASLRGGPRRGAAGDGPRARPARAACARPRRRIPAPRRARDGSPPIPGSADPGTARAGEPNDLLQQDERERRRASASRTSLVRPAGTCTIASRGAVLARRRLQEHGEVEAEGRQQRKWSAHVDRQRRQHRRTESAEEAPSTRPLAVIQIVDRRRSGCRRFASAGISSSIVRRYSAATNSVRPRPRPRSAAAAASARAESGEVSPS